MYSLEKEYYTTKENEYHRADAMYYAQYWHSGQFSELYKLSSSGYVDDPIGLLSEISDCVPQSDNGYYDDESGSGDYPDDMQLDCLKGYALALIKQEKL